MKLLYSLSSLFTRSSAMLAMLAAYGTQAAPQSTDNNMEGLNAVVLPGVDNSGMVVANVKKGDSKTPDSVDLYGDGLYGFAVPKDKSKNKDQAGYVPLSKQDAREVVNNAVNMKGVGQAKLAHNESRTVVVLNTHPTAGAPATDNIALARGEDAAKLMPAGGKKQIAKHTAATQVACDHTGAKDSLYKRNLEANRASIADLAPASGNNAHCD